MAIQADGSRCYCNVLAMQRGLDPVGSAHDFDDAVVAEVPLPWKPDLYEKAGALPQEVIDLLALWLQRYREGMGYRHGALMVAPDPEYSRAGFRRVLFYTRPEGAFARFDKVEYLVPEDRYGALIWALYEARDQLPAFEPYRQTEHDSTRDLLVCTHGTVDAACARFGYPLYRNLRDNYADEHLRVWRVSHFGGHVFAPTLIEMPTGHYWAYVEDAQARQIARRDGDVRDLYGCYRGWAGLTSAFLQAAERELWMRHGWDWFGYRKTGRIMAQDDGDTPMWADVSIEFAAPDGTATFDARVEVSKHIETEHSSHDPARYPYQQYRVTHLAKQGVPAV